MTLDHRRIETIVSEVLERLEAQRAGREAGARPGPASPLGVHPDLDSAIQAAQEAFAAYDPLPLLHSVEQPTLEVAQSLLRAKGIRLNVVTGGPAVVREALNAGKKAITAGPGNPPSVVDETADLERAARDLIAGASLDNNIICTDEKEVIAVALIADRLKECVARAGAVVLPPHQTERLRGLLLEKEHGPRKHAVIQRKYVGKNIDVILRDAGIPGDP